jgi:hypothetical protein
MTLVFFFSAHCLLCLHSCSVSHGKVSVPWNISYVPHTINGFWWHDESKKKNTWFVENKDIIIIIIVYQV